MAKLRLLQELMDRVRASSEKVGLLINTDKTQVMTCGNNGMNTRMSLSGEVLEEVESFVYLGSIFNSDGSCTQDVRKRLAIAGKVGNAVIIINMGK